MNISLIVAISAMVVSVVSAILAGIALKEQKRNSGLAAISTTAAAAVVQKQGSPESRDIELGKLVELERDIRSMIEHDNELLNHRTQWFLTISGFLFTAIALYGNQPGRNWFGTALGVVGLMTCFSYWAALRVGDKARERLECDWERYKKRGPTPEEGFCEVGIFGFNSTGWEGKYGPWNLLPWIVVLGWVLVFVFVWYFPGQRPPGSYVPAVYRAGEQVRIIDTASGKSK